VVSTFGSLNTAYSGLVAARTGIDVTGQNIANVNTEGYTRQRVGQSSVEAPARAGLFSGGVVPGQGVSVDAIARLGNAVVDGQVRGAAAAAGYASVRADALSTLEQGLGEPRSTGIAAQLGAFWNSWSDVGSHPAETGPAAVLLGQAKTLAASIASGHQAVEDQWSAARGSAQTLSVQLNDAARQVADLNDRIRSAVQAGTSPNELIDARSRLTEQIASIAGGTVRDAGDGTVDVLVGGNALVSGTTARSVVVKGEFSMGASTGVTVEWAHRPGDAVVMDGGSLAGTVSLLGPASAGRGGVLAEAAASYDALATQLATQVDTVHAGGVRADGQPAGDFFSFAPGVSAARGLTVVPTGASSIASGGGKGALDGSVAQAIAQIGVGSGSPDRAWSSTVASIGAAAKSETAQSSLADLAASSAKNRQLSGSGVSLDEENVSLLSYQHAYQGAARVMTAIDEMLDTLINGMGRVGR
jgi:flagellar hook-associated protein 1 FlgK